MRWLLPLALLLAAACGADPDATDEPDAGFVAMCERTTWTECGTDGVSNRCDGREQLPCSSCVEVCTSGKPCGRVCILSGTRCEDNERTHLACRPL